MKDNIVKATIITIGDELLIGQVIDTNSAWIATHLNESGIWLHRRVSIGDKKEDIVTTLKEESEEADIIIITGGLGPTADDITKPVLCEYFGGKLISNEEVLNHVKNIFEKRNLPFTERNAKQAEVPDNCTVLFNPVGTAPGMMFEKGGKLYFSLPGVPMEMMHIMTNKVLPLLSNRFQHFHILHRTLVTSGIGESFLADLIQPWEEKLPDYIQPAYLPGHGLIRLRLTGKHANRELLEKSLDKEFSELKNYVSEYLIVDEDLTLVQFVSRLMKDKQLTLSTAESCTGGYIAHLITSEPGASAFYYGSVISYDNSVKEGLLGVTAETLKTQGAVSKETVTEMAMGALKLLNTNYAIAVSGILGPSGGTPEKPVGTVWIAVANKNTIHCKEYHFPYNRVKNIQMVANTALNNLRKLILQQEN